LHFLSSQLASFKSLWTNKSGQKNTWTFRFFAIKTKPQLKAPLEISLG